MSACFIGWFSDLAAAVAARYLYLPPTFDQEMSYDLIVLSLSLKCCPFLEIGIPY
jgi:hypothetical protein